VAAKIIGVAVEIVKVVAVVFDFACAHRAALLCSTPYFTPNFDGSGLGRSGR
jgi:hypothetical protein